MSRVVLRMIQVVDFRKSEQTNFDLIPKKERAAFRGTDVVCFVSGGGDQVVFVSPPGELTNGEKPVGFTASNRVRLQGRHRFNAELLADYGAQAGKELVGLPRFSEVLKARADDQRTRRRELAKKRK